MRAFPAGHSGQHVAPSADPWRIWLVRAGIGALAMIFAASGRANAQPATPPGTTVLHLSATASVQISPDQLVADLVAQKTSPSAATAQRTVNSMMSAGLKASHAVPGIEARAIGYSVVPTGDKNQAWIAQQTLELRGVDGPSLLDLAGKLQGEGFAAGSIDWQLSPGLRDHAHNEATTIVLKRLQSRAGSAAAAFGLHVDHAQDIRLDTPFFQPHPMMAMAVRGAPSPAPQATAAPEEVTATASGDFILRP